MNGERNDRPSLLLVDDDDVFAGVLGRALEGRGYAVQTAHDIETAMRVIAIDPPEYAVVDLRLASESGLTLVERLHAADAHTRIVMLTGYASIATAVEAVKLGATYYLVKPSDADEIVAALDRHAGDANTPVSSKPLCVGELEWEHINKVLTEHAGNISASARVLGMHRRTLQRKLAKRPGRDRALAPESGADDLEDCGDGA